MRYHVVEFCMNSTGLKSMANVLRHYENSPWYQSRVILVIRYEQPSKLKPGTLSHTMQYVRRK